MSVFGEDRMFHLFNPNFDKPVALVRKVCSFINLAKKACVERVWNFKWNLTKMQLFGYMIDGSVTSVISPSWSTLDFSTLCTTMIFFFFLLNIFFFFLLLVNKEFNRSVIVFALLQLCCFLLSFFPDINYNKLQTLGFWMIKYDC